MRLANRKFIMTIVVSRSNPVNSEFTSGDTGTGFFPNPLREQYFQIGYISGTFSGYLATLGFQSTWKLREYFRSREEAARIFRERLNYKSERLAFKRAGRLARRPLFIEAEQCGRRYARGRHHAFASLVYGLNRVLGISPTTPIFNVVDKLHVYLLAVIKWGATTPLDAVQGECEPPFWTDILRADERKAVAL